MPMKYNGKLKKILGYGAAVTFVIGLPLLAASIAHGAASDAPAAPDAIAAMAPGNLVGDPIAQPVGMPADPAAAAKIKRGEYLAVAGDCQECHSIPGRPAYSGGLAVGSPVGAIFSPNITPDKTYGIGNWTDAQFYAALHEGIGPGSSLLVFPHYLYPSMPSDAYSKLSYDDVMAIKAYLDSIQPAAIPNRPTQIPFPLNIRAALLGWRILFFHVQPVQYDPSWSPSVRNGAFLVQALAHCSDCHTPRNLLMGSETDKFLAGGHILAQSWYAPNISSRKQGGGVGSWSPADLANYLGGGGQVGVGAAYGPMQQVVNDSLSRLPPSDVQDIVAYLQTATAPQDSSAPAAPSMPTQANGAVVYADNCARCHGANGEGVNNNFPNLAGNQSVWDGPPNNIISMVLGGFYPWHDDQSAMPNFRTTLSDDEIAAVSNYVRTAWGNQGSADATSGMVGKLRGYTTTEMDLDTASTKAALQTGDASVAFNDISGHLSFDGDQINCQIAGHFGATNQTVDIGGACADGGSRFIGQATMNGQTMPVNFKISEERSGSGLNAIDLDGPMGGSQLHARMSLVTPNG